MPHGYRDVPDWAREAWLGALSLGVISTVVAFLIFFWAVRRFGPGRGAMVSYLAPVAALTLAFFVLGERPLPLQLAGAIVIVLVVRLAAARRSVGSFAAMQGHSARLVEASRDVLGTFRSPLPT